MPSFSPNVPKLVRGGIVVMAPGQATVTAALSFQYNPDSVKRSLQPQWYEGRGAEGGERLRLKGPPAETINVELELDATDALGDSTEPDHAVAAEFGVAPQLAALESLLYPTADHLESNNALQSAGTLEIVPAEAPLTVFVWSAKRVTPVRLTDLSVTEEFFDTELNPIRATVSLGMRVLTVADLGFNHPGGKLFLRYLRRKEDLAGKGTRGSLAELGLRGGL
jgi:hypothetical protein